MFNQTDAIKKKGLIADMKLGVHV